MRKKINKGKYTEREWIELASVLSDEKNDESGLKSRFEADGNHDTAKQWKEIGMMSNSKEIDVDRAWEKLNARIRENSVVETAPVRRMPMPALLLRVAAVFILMLTAGSFAYYLANGGSLKRPVTVASGAEQKNILVSLPDGSTVYLNRDSRLTYNVNYGKEERIVRLTGEAFFDINHDASRPFVVKAGKARVRVLGTSFNVISDNSDSSVEVYVKSGRVLLSDDTGEKSIVLDPGFIGKLNSESPEKMLNDDPNYMAWNTGELVYDGQTLDVVFRDLKRVYNMEIVADDPAILGNPWTSPINNQPQETIIRLICASFNLVFTKDGEVYHLSEK